MTEAEPSWWKKLSEKIQLRFIFLNNVQIGLLRQYAPRPVVYDTLPKTEGKLPRLAIATPSYNQAAFLPATVESVWQGQGRVEVDYFVQDGASTDGSVAYLESQPGLRWVSEKDGGQADAVNRGLRKCSGDIMAWINSDDTYAPGALEYVAGYFRDHPEVDVIYGHRIVIDEGGREVGRWVLPANAHETLDYFDYIPQETVFFRRKFWEQVNGVDAAYQFALDWYLLKKLREAGARFARVPYFLACFRVHSDQKTSQTMGSHGAEDKRRLLGDAAPAPREVIGRAWFRHMRQARWAWLLLQLGIRA